MISAPGEPRGDSAEAKWLRHLLQFVKSIALREGIGYLRNVTSEGTTLVIQPGGGGIGLRRLRYKSSAKDYLVCRDWDGTTEGTEDVYVAKVPKLRGSVASEVLDAVTFNYTYTAPAYVERVSTNATTAATETQKLIPRLIVNDEIFAIETNPGVSAVIDGDTVDFSLLDLNLDARAWAAQ